MLLSNNPDQSKVLLLWIKNCRRARGHGSTESTTQRKVSGSSRAFRYFLINVPLLKDESKLLASQLPWFQIWTLTLCTVIIRSLDPSLYIISTILVLSGVRSVHAEGQDPPWLRVFVWILLWREAARWPDWLRPRPDGSFCDGSRVAKEEMECLLSETEHIKWIELEYGRLRTILQLSSTMFFQQLFHLARWVPWYHLGHVGTLHDLWLFVALSDSLLHRVVKLVKPEHFDTKQFWMVL